jgi:hypothetical protein
MLHPNLGVSRNPWETWQVDTDEIATVACLYAHHLSGVEEPEQVARRLGMLWKKLCGAPRLAGLVLQFAQMRMSDRSVSRAHRDVVGWRFFDQALWAMVDRPASIHERSPSRYAEDDPLYDRWLDG